MSQRSIAEWMALAQQDSEQSALASNPSCPPEVLLWLAKNMAEPNYSGIFTNPALPPEAIEHLLLHSDSEYEKRDLVDLPNFQERFVEFCINDSDESLRAAAARRASRKYLHLFAKDSDWGVRYAVARNAETPFEILIELLHDRDSDVVCGVLEGKQDYLLAENSSAPKEIWEELFKSKPMNGEVERKVAEIVPAEFIHIARGWVSPENSHFFLRNIYMPKEWADEFLADETLDREQVVEFLVGFGHLRDEHIPIVLQSMTRERRVRMAMQPSLTIETQKILAKDKSVEVRERLATNPMIDHEILLLLTNDKSLSVLDALDREIYWDAEKLEHFPYTGRENLRELASEQKKRIKTASKSKTVEGRSEALQSEVFDKSRYEELMQDKSIGIQVSATLRAAELGLITFKEAAAFVTKNTPSSSAPKNRWVEARMATFEAEGNEEYLDLILELKGDRVLADKIFDFPHMFTSSQILKISAAHLPITNWQIGTKCALNPEILDELAQTPSWSYEAYGMHGKELEFGQWLSETDTAFRIVCYPQALAAKHPETRRETLEKLRKSRSQYVRGVLLQRPDFVTNKDLTRAAKDKDKYVRCIVAAHDSVPLEVLEILAGDEDKEVRELASRNPRATPEIKAIAALLNT